ncbi:MAG: hypothetical protein K5685_09625 [Bacteroidales bacterium]|nr:hypothetical protein [Bacteroidales bacterium]
MTKQYYNTIALSILLIGLTLTSCGGSGNTAQNGTQNNNTEEEITVNVDFEAYGLTKDFLAKYDTLKIADFGDLIQSFPSPVEVSAIIKDSKVKYDHNYLFNTQISQNFETTYKKSLGLGVYCADLGYLNVYDQTGDVLEYLVTIRKLTDDLKLGQFFDFAALKRIATNNNNLDSLLILSTMSYYKMDAYLRNNDRANVSALMVTGVWTESLYLASKVYLEKENKRMRDHIASQKYILDELMAILIHYMGNNVNYVKLVSAFKELAKAYEPVVIEVIEGEDKTEEIDGHSVTTQGSNTIINVSNEQMIQICKAVETLRKKIAEAL